MTAVRARKQIFSDSYTVLKAVKERDGAKVTDLSARLDRWSSTLATAATVGGLIYMVRGRDLKWLDVLLGREPDPTLEQARRPPSTTRRRSAEDGAEHARASRERRTFNAAARP